MNDMKQLKSETPVETVSRRHLAIMAALISITILHALLTR